MERMALIDLDLNTVELFEDVRELQDIIDRFKDDINDLDNKIMVKEEKILSIFQGLRMTKGKEKIRIVNYYDHKEKKFYDELSYDEWKALEGR